MKTDLKDPKSQTDIIKRMDYLRSEISRMQAELNYLEYIFDMMMSDSNQVSPKDLKNFSASSNEMEREDLL